MKKKGKTLPLFEKKRRAAISKALEKGKSKYKLVKKFEFSDTHRCPKCGKRGKDRADIIKKFGLRNDGGFQIAQSFCKECR